MRSFRASMRQIRIPYIPAFATLFLLMATVVLPSHTAERELGNEQESSPVPQSSASPSQEPLPQEAQAPVSKYDKAIFQKPIPSAQLAFLTHFEGSSSNDALRDKQYGKLLHSVVPDCIFHYGSDMSLFDALDTVLKGSSLPVQIRDSRYVMVSGRSGPYLAGRGFMWIDMQDGIALGGFYFHPTNGEPTPTVTIFSKQVKEKSLAMSQLPAAFAEDLSRWSIESHVPAIVTRYFITGSDEKIVLEHDEDYCAPADGKTAPPDDVCRQMNADAADIDVNAAYYLEQTSHATNATAWMIEGEDQVEWVQLREVTCTARPDRLSCHIRMTRERTHAIINRHPVPHTPHR